MNTQTKPNYRQHRRVKSPLYFLGLLVNAVLIVAMLSAFAPAPAHVLSDGINGRGKHHHESSAGTDAIVTWNQNALTAIQKVTPNPVFQYAYLAQIQLAVYNAVVAIEGDFQPFKSELERSRNASVEAAVAAAAHGILVNLFQNQQTDLDNQFNAFIAALPAGPARDAGVDLGHQAAAEVIAMRTGDGMGADIGFVMPAPGPGVFQLPAGTNPVVPWASKMTPYILKSPSQFRPGPSPDLGSEEYATMYEETRRLGGVDSTERTPEQTDAARFWVMSPAVQYNQLYQSLAQQRGLSTTETARMFVMGDVVVMDALIGCFDAKYTYVFWRPSYAIPLGDTDGNPLTTAEPTWKPLLATPGYPEYISGHGCVTSATAEVLSAALGTRRIKVDISSNVANLVQPVRHFEYARDLTKEIIEARIWGGLHFRVSDVKGVQMGRKVAQYALKRHFQPVDESRHSKHH